MDLGEAMDSSQESQVSSNKQNSAKTEAAKVNSKKTLASKNKTVSSASNKQQQSTKSRKSINNKKNQSRRSKRFLNLGEKKSDKSRKILDREKSNKIVEKEKSNKNVEKEKSNKNVEKEKSNKNVEKEKSNKNVEKEKSNKNVEKEKSNKTVDNEKSNKNVDKEKSNKNVDKEKSNKNVEKPNKSKKAVVHIMELNDSDFLTQVINPHVKSLLASSFTKFDEDSESSSIPSSSSLIKDYGIHELLGEGSYSRVYRVTKRNSPRQEFACKRYKINERTRRWVDRCLTREMDIALRVHHPKIIKAYEAFYHKDEAFLILQLAPNGSIRSRILGLPYYEFFKEITIRNWYSDMLSAVAYLHGKEIAHRDIKTDNFLFDRAMTPLLCDFSFACLSPTPNTRFDCMVETVCGTSVYLAPEVHSLKDGERYNAKNADVYALGVCLFELFNKNVPFVGRFTLSDPKLISMQANREYAINENVDMSDAAYDLLNALLEPNPRIRISVNRALLDDWFKLDLDKHRRRHNGRDKAPYHKFSQHMIENTPHHLRQSSIPKNEGSSDQDSEDRSVHD